MHIKTLTLENFRGASSLAIELHPKLNVLVGMNGVGKSTVIDAIAIMLSWGVNRIRHSGTSGRPIAETDITNQKSSASIEICLYKDKEIKWRLAKSLKGQASQYKPSNLTQLSDYAKKIQTQISTNGQNANIPLFIYYPVNRAVLDIPLRIRKKHSFGLLTAYNDALERTGTNFRSFFEWFREREDLENENKVRHSQQASDGLANGLDYCDPQLKAVRDALHRFLPEFRNLAIRRSPLRMEVEKDGQCLRIDQLSDGEKCFIAMISDLARRMAIANPVGDPLEGEGIILIDEIDMHLHPKWQRMIVSKLLDVFPNCQFILSTHSPHVLSHIQPENIFLLSWGAESIVSQKPLESYGKNTDRILEDLMGLDTTRPDIVSSDLHTIYEMIQNNHLDDAKNKIKTVRQTIRNDPELVKAEVLIRRKEIIGK
ncbi:AAA family ATPase [Leptolyngbya cf. ectocarpi LEGE 11479]|uniref:AAA family ATPase n=1 Tax=Leptolyngbya cf. ectocarpi LEGE 11479 TaxID=1828722 RepID=A0A929A028_LEPEC|nr:AAA family ATPase [Leptolyngbya ectocarpi]MBE9070600.1 AAA family ATPase [Leptolyngbya cf. ectocarpi LEGE 11479]